MSGIDVGFLLDRQWHALRGEMESTKQSALLALARVLDEAGVQYAIIGGVALQVHQEEPRTTLDIDLAVRDLDLIPRIELEQAGFCWTGRFAHSENWAYSDGVPVQFTGDAALTSALARAVDVDLAGIRLRVIGIADLLHEKLRAGSDPARTRSNRLQDLVDAHGLVEQHPDLATELTAVERGLLGTLPE